MRISLLSLIIVFASVARAVAQRDEASSLHPEIEVMRSFAPILWLAADEPTRPMLPHALAFDGVNNFGGTGKDLDNLQELSWDVEAPFEAVVHIFDQQSAARDIRARVLYEAPSLNPEWVRRVGDSYVYALEYWFYYPYDRGMGGGHKGDSEHTFVFVAIDKELEEFSDLLAGRVVGIVGAGHNTHTANNVLVAGSNSDPKGEIFPNELPRHVPILVELGKHASAPDRNFDGRFDVGADVNLFRDAAWGSRDIRPSSIFHYIGDFDDWYSLPRDEHDIWIDSEYDDEAFYPGYRDTYPARFPPDPSSNSHFNRYTLFPLRDLACLYQLLGREADADPNCHGSVEAFLEQHKECFWLDGAPTSISISPEAMTAMRRWPDPDEWEGETHHISLFEHQDARDPNNIFKLHLYPAIALGGAVELDEPGGSGPLVQASIRVSEITRGVSQWFPNSMIELNFNWDPETWQLSNAELHYLFFRGSYSGFFTGVNVRNERLAGGDEVSLEDAMKLGFEIPDREPMSRIRWGVDVGWAINFNLQPWLHKDLFLDTKLGVRAELFQHAPSDLELALGAQDRIRVMVSIGLRWGITHPLNPLAY